MKSKNESRGNTWPFTDPPNVAVFISERILNGSEWIYYVTHDDDDGAWQFHPKSSLTQEHEARVVSLKSVYDLDKTIGALHDLPRGWCAWREERKEHWHRAVLESVGSRGG